MISTDKITEIYVIIDDFRKEFATVLEGHVLNQESGLKRRNKPSKLSDSEVMTILIAFHLSGFRNLKHYYLHYVCKHLKQEFPRTVSYNRFVELQQK